MCKVALIWVHLYLFSQTMHNEIFLNFK